MNITQESEEMGKMFSSKIENTLSNLILYLRSLPREKAHEELLDLVTNYNLKENTAKGIRECIDNPEAEFNFYNTTETGY